MIEFLWNVFFRGRWRSALITHKFHEFNLRKKKSESNWLDCLAWLASFFAEHWAVPAPLTHKEKQAQSNQPTLRRKRANPIKRNAHSSAAFDGIAFLFPWLAAQRLAAWCGELVCSSLFHCLFFFIPFHFMREKTTNSRKRKQTQLLLLSSRSLLCFPPAFVSSLGWLPWRSSALNPPKENSTAGGKQSKPRAPQEQQLINYSLHS